MLIRVFLILIALESFARAGCPAGNSCDPTTGTATACPAKTYAPVDSYYCLTAPPGKDTA